MHFIGKPTVLTRDVNKRPPSLVDMSCEQTRLLSHKTCSQDMSDNCMTIDTVKRPRQETINLNRHTQDTLHDLFTRHAYKTVTT